MADNKKKTVEEIAVHRLGWKRRSFGFRLADFAASVLAGIGNTGRNMGPLFFVGASLAWSVVAVGGDDVFSGSWPATGWNGCIYGRISYLHSPLLLLKRIFAKNMKSIRNSYLLVACISHISISKSGWRPEGPGLTCDTQLPWPCWHTWCPVVDAKLW